MAARETSLSVAAACLVALLAVLSPCREARAREISDIPAAFVDIGVGAREMGMGGAAVASSTGPEAVFWNPARLAAAETRDGLVLTHSDVMGLVPYSAACGAKRLGEALTLGVGVLYSGDDALSEMTAIVSAATTLETPVWMPDGPIQVGISARVRRASFAGSSGSSADVSGDAFGAALDAGLVVPVAESARLAVSGRDVLGVLNWKSSSSGSYEEGVPPALVFGLAVDLGSAVIEVDLDRALSQDARDVLAAGVEVEMFDVAALRAGYRRALPPDQMEELAVGGGVVLPAACSELTLDVAYLFGRLDNTLRLGIGLSF